MSNFTFFLIFLLNLFPFPTISRPNPRATLSLGGNGRMIVNIKLEKFPPAAFALMSIGDPPVVQELHIDTGCPLTWVLPVPYSNSKYDPSTSSTFAYRSCAGLPVSNHLFPGKTKDQCDYNLRLGDGAYYKGTLGLESFTFQTGDNGFGLLKNVIFGFGKTIGGGQAGSGTLGLSMDEYSIVRSFGGKFSICIGELGDMGITKNFLAMGDDSLFLGAKISLQTLSPHYTVNMTSILINGKELGKYVPPTMVDAGNSAISLVPTLYNEAIGKIQTILNDAGYNTRYGSRSLECYRGKVPTNLELVLSLKFGRVIVQYRASKLLVQVEDDKFCVMVNKSPIQKNIIGITGFQGHNIGFDLANNKLYVKAENCKNLYDSYKDELDHPNP